MREGVVRHHRDYRAITCHVLIGPERGSSIVLIVSIRPHKLVFQELGLSPKFTSKFSQPSKTAKFTQGELGQICPKGVRGLRSYFTQICW